MPTPGHEIREALFSAPMGRTARFGDAEMLHAQVGFSYANSPIGPTNWPNSKGGIGSFTSNFRLAIGRPIDAIDLGAAHNALLI
jgi:hypothetical protein